MENPPVNYFSDDTPYGHDFDDPRLVVSKRDRSIFSLPPVYYVAIYESQDYEPADSARGRIARPLSRLPVVGRYLSRDPSRQPAHVSCGRPYNAGRILATELLAVDLDAARDVYGEVRQAVDSPTEVDRLAESLEATGIATFRPNATGPTRKPLAAAEKGGVIKGLIDTLLSDEPAADADGAINGLLESGEA